MSNLKKPDVVTTAKSHMDIEFRFYEKDDTVTSSHCVQCVFLDEAHFTVDVFERFFKEIAAGAILTLQGDGYDCSL